MSYALITGASKGIGKAIAIELAKRKIPVILVARNEQLLEDLSNQIKETHQVDAKFFAVDLAQPDGPKNLVSLLNQSTIQVHILVNNAGYGLSGMMNKYSLKEHTEMMQVNMQTPVALTYLLLPSLQKQNKAFILNIASAAAYQSVPGLNVYAATKAFVLSFSRGLAYELKQSNISVTAVSPGATDTNFAHAANVNGKKAQKMAAQFNMQPTDVAKVATDAMFAQKKEVVVGFVNKLTVFLAWLLPKSILEKSAAEIYDL
jgi:short-subunit dehydrogenase